MARSTRPFTAREAGSVDRMSRVNDLLRDTIAELVSRELKDPRLDLALLSVTEVRASRDLRNATVFISTMTAPDSTPEEQARAGLAAIDALTHAAPFIHRTIRRRLHMKRIPWPSFELDSRIAGSAEIQERIRALSESRPAP